MNSLELTNFKEASNKVRRLIHLDDAQRVSNHPDVLSRKSMEEIERKAYLAAKLSLEE